MVLIVAGKVAHGEAFKVAFEVTSDHEKIKVQDGNMVLKSELSFRIRVDRKREPPRRERGRGDPNSHLSTWW